MTLTVGDILTILGMVLAAIAWSTAWAMKIVRGQGEHNSHLKALNGRVERIEKRVDDIEHDAPWKSSIRDFKAQIRAELNQAVESVSDHWKRKREAAPDA